MSERLVRGSLEQTGVINYKTFLFTKPSEGLNLILFNPEIFTFGCKIGYNLDNEAGENSKMKAKGRVLNKILQSQKWSKFQTFTKPNAKSYCLSATEKLKLKSLAYKLQEKMELH